MASLTLSAPAKLNLHLAVLDRGADGYRHLETLFVAIDFCDQVHLETTDQPGVELEVVGDAGGAVGDDNLVARAAHCFFEAADVTGGVVITLEKSIPPGAGLGGGSSDAGATLRGLNTLFGSPLDQDDLARVGAPLGADVPFFATGAKAAWGFGRGRPSAPLACARLPARRAGVAERGIEYGPSVWSAEPGPRGVRRGWLAGRDRSLGRPLECVGAHHRSRPQRLRIGRP